MRVRFGWALAVLVGCSSSTGSPPPIAPEADAGIVATDASAAELGGDRPVALHVPGKYVTGVAAPLVILLHGYTASGEVQEGYFGLTALSDARGFLYAHPDGTFDADRKRYWNATDACCDFGGTKVDDAKYLTQLIADIQARYTVDAKRIFLVGHSNGGFMAYRMACDHADRIAAIVSLAGAMFADVTRCNAASPVSILQIHGTADATIKFEGGQLGAAYPGAKETVADWAKIDGCADLADTSAGPLDLESKLAGSETAIAKYATGCKPGGHAELWTIEGGSHVPALTKKFAPAIVDFLYAHPKP